MRSCYFHSILCLSYISLSYSISQCLKIPDPKVQSARNLMIQDLITLYKSKHNAEVIENEAKINPAAFCARRYHASRACGCGNLGNNQFDLIGGFLHAIILNRTFAYNSIACDDHLTFQSWIIQSSRLMTLIKDTCGSQHSESDISALQGFFVPDFKEWSCYADDFPYLAINSWNGELMPFFMFNDYSGALLGAQASRRRDILFSNPIYMNSRYESMGYAFNNVLQFSPAVMKLCQPLIDTFINPYPSCSYQDVMVIGVHMRHFNIDSRKDPSLDAKDDEQYKHQLENLLSSSRDDRKCITLIASDRVESIHRMFNYSAALGCESMIVPRPEMKDNLFENCNGDEQCLEQGPFAKGILQLADIYLLGHAQYFLGTSTSSYSQMIAGIISWNHHQHVSGDFSWISPIRFEANKVMALMDRFNYGYYTCHKNVTSENLIRSRHVRQRRVR